MSDNLKPASRDLSAEIADNIRASIVAGELIVNARLPSETELAQRFGVSRSTLREALKRLAAQSLIRTQRGASGGAFVNRLSYEEARAQHVTTSTLLLSMNGVSFATACEARFALERACANLAAQHREQHHIDRMETEFALQIQPSLSDEAFCASDVRFHRALVDATQNPVLCYQMAGAVEAMQPLMNMLTYNRRSREGILRQHETIIHALKERDCSAIEAALDTLCAETRALAVG